jgi:hypothetical protein
MIKYTSIRTFLATRLSKGYPTFALAAPHAPSTTLSPVPSGEVQARLHKRLAGSVTIREGIDISAPTGEAWDAEQ